MRADLKEDDYNAEPLPPADEQEDDEELAVSAQEGNGQIAPNTDVDTISIMSADLKEDDYHAEPLPPADEQEDDKELAVSTQKGNGQIAPNTDVEIEDRGSLYAENPLMQSIVFILALDFCERFAYNGIVFTMPGYLTGYYEPQWNPGYAPFEANGYIAAFQGIGFVTPFIAAVVADVLIGDYWATTLFTGLCYIPGALLIAIVSIPYSEGRTDFPLEQLKLGTHILLSLGFGAAKTLYGVYAAKQYDPINQANQLENFFVIFTGVEFLGSFLGALISIILADLLVEPHPRNGLVIAEFINAGAVIFGLLIFLIASRRYVHGKLMRRTYGLMFGSLLEAVFCFRGFSKTKESNGGRIPDAAVEGMIQIILLFPVFLLIVPLNIAFTQAVVVNITSCAFMRGVGPLKGPLLVSTSLLFIGVWAFLIKKFLSPFLQKKQIHLSIPMRFSLGSFCLGCSYVVTAIMDSQIKRAYRESASQISIFYGLFGTFMSGGVAFHFSAMNEIAFTVAPAELKMLGTAVMLFMSQGVPNIIGSILFKACAPWFRDPDGNKIRTIQQYVDANSVNFTYLMLVLCLFNALIMLLPPVKNWINRVEENSIANNAARAQAQGGARA